MHRHALAGLVLLGLLCGGEARKNYQKQVNEAEGGDSKVRLFAQHTVARRFQIEGPCQLFVGLNAIRPAALRSLNGFPTSSSRSRCTQATCGQCKDMASKAAKQMLSARANDPRAARTASEHFPALIDECAGGFIGDEGQMAKFVREKFGER
jgi:hypothetical protein